jgi:hypothetical protein
MNKYFHTLLFVFVGITSISGLLTFAHYLATAQTATNCTDITFCWNHVYDPNRLLKQQTFVTVTGNVTDDPISEPDGDTHFVITLDPTFAHLSKPINCEKHATGFEDAALVQGQGQQTSNCNKIIVEIICHNSIDSKKFPKPAAACGSYHSSEIMTPKYGQHLRVSGSYVFDHDHNDWAEIHPVFKLELMK